MTWRRTQSSINKYVPDTERSPAPDTSPTSRGPTPLERSMQQARHAEDTPLDPRTTPQEQSSARAAHPRGSASQGRLTHTHASVKAASHTPTRPSCPPPRTCQARRVRPRRSACPDSPGSLPSRSQESPSQQPRTLENPSLSGGTSGRYWAASAVSLRAYRRPSGQSLWDSWTPCPTCGVCVTTTLPRCPNGVRDH